MTCTIRFSVIETLMNVKIPRTCGKIGRKIKKSRLPMPYTVCNM